MMATQVFNLILCLALCMHFSIAIRDPKLDSNYQFLLIAPLQEQEDADALVAPEAESVQWTDSAQDASGASLTIRVMHRDSPHSPLRNLQATPKELLTERLNRDAARVEALSTRAKLASKGLKNGDLAVEAVTYTAKKDTIAGFTGPLMSGLKQGSGEYFTRLGVGTPARQTHMVVDTGSDIMWLQCAPCVDCYAQTDPVFNPTSSSSFRKLPCTSPMCAMVELHGCEAKSNLCLYQVAYGDGSFTEGEFSTEALSFTGATVKSVAMGCGHDNEGLFAGAAGLFSLGGGSLSFPSQMGRRFMRIFSYCLMDRDREGYSTLIFGNAGVPRGTVFTPLLKNPSLETFYYVSLSGISVGGNMLTIPATAFKMDSAGSGGVIVDSGTSVTRLVEVAYGPLRSAFRAATESLPFSGGFSLFDTCYDLSGRTSVKLPTVSLHFAGEAELTLPAQNYMIPVDSQGTYCLAFASTSGDLSIIGNIQQQGFRVVFDGVSSRLGFAANQC